MKHKQLLIAVLVVSSAFVPFFFLGANSPTRNQVRAVEEESPEDWTDGPGVLATRNGVNRSLYAKLWNLDVDRGEEKYNPDQPLEEDIEDDGRVSWKRQVNLADSLDYTTFEYLGIANGWNSEAASGFGSEYGGYPEISHVPQSIQQNGQTTGGRFIKKAYIHMYAISPKFIQRKYVPGGGEHFYIAESGTIYTAIDYRDVSPGDNNPHKNITWEHLEREILFHRLTKTPNCTEGDCLLANETGNSHTKALSYPGQQEKIGERTSETSNIETDLYIDGKIRTRWKKYVETCEEPNDDDHDGLTNSQEEDLGTDENDKDSDGDGINDKSESNGSTDPTDSDTDGDGVDDSSDPEPTNSDVPSSGTDTPSGSENVEVPVVESGGGSIRFSHSNNLDNNGTCDNWSEPETSIHPETITVSNSFHVETLRNPPAPVIWKADFPQNKTETAVFTPVNSRFWTYAELPNGDRITSGFEYFVSRDPRSSRIWQYYSEDAAPQIGSNMYAPSKTTMFVSDVQVYRAAGTNVSERAYNQRIVYAGGGSELSIGDKPENLIAAWPDSNTFVRPDTIVFSTFDGNGGPITFHGPAGQNTKSASVERTVVRSNITANVVEYDSETNQATIEFTLEEVDGGGINTAQRGDPIEQEDARGYIVFNGERYETNAQGEFTFEGEIRWKPRGYTVKYVPVKWYRLPTQKQAYISDTDSFSVGGTVDFVDLLISFIDLFIVLGVLYFILKRVMKKIGIDISKPVQAFFDTLEKYFRIF